ncbi:MAG: hypothetical protein Q7U73_04995 [Rubrivivax sp.]|nr:hypothetical protein [Rubrivivax sp.]
MSAAVQLDTAPTEAQQLTANTMADLLRLVVHHEHQRAGTAAAERVMHDFAKGLTQFDFRVSFDSSGLRLMGAEVTPLGRRVVVEEQMHFPPSAVAAGLGSGGTH